MLALLKLTAEKKEALINPLKKSTAIIHDEC